MKRTALALALAALSISAAMAASGDAWYGSNRDIVVTTPTPRYVEPAPAPADSVTVYYDAPVATAPVIVERRYVTTQPYDVVVVDPAYDNDSRLFQIEPRKYGNVYNGGLFPRRGPNDFGQ